MLSGRTDALLSALALDGVPGVLGAGELLASWSTWCAADCDVAVSMAGKGRLDGVCWSCWDFENLVGEFGPESELGEDQAVIKLSTAVVEMLRQRSKGREGGCETATHLWVSACWRGFLGLGVAQRTCQGATLDWRYFFPAA